MTPARGLICLVAPASVTGQQAHLVRLDLESLDMAGRDVCVASGAISARRPLALKNGYAAVAGSLRHPAHTYGMLAADSPIADPVRPRSRA